MTTGLRLETLDGKSKARLSLPRHLCSPPPAPLLWLLAFTHRSQEPLQHPSPTPTPDLSRRKAQTSAGEHDGGRSDGRHVGRVEHPAVAAAAVRRRARAGAGPLQAPHGPARHLRRHRRRRRRAGGGAAGVQRLPRGARRRALGRLQVGAGARVCVCRLCSPPSHSTCKVVAVAFSRSRTPNASRARSFLCVFWVAAYRTAR